MTLLSPLGLLVLLATAAPVVAWWRGHVRSERVRGVLGLPAPDARSLHRPVAAAATVFVLGLACGQPALTRDEQRRVRTDAAVIVVVDVSRSMSAAASPDAVTRLDRARDIAVRVRASLPEVPVGVASMTDRVVPLLFPSPNPSAFDETVRRALVSESPPPREANAVATTLDAVGDAAAGNLFLSSDRHRALLVLTDGESRPYAEAEVARALRAAHISLVTIHVGRMGERPYRGSGAPERLYRPDPLAQATLDALANAAGGASFDEDEAPGAAAALVRAVGDGPTRSVGTSTHVVPLAPWLCLLALLPLLVALDLRAGDLAKGLRPSTVRATIHRR